MKIQALVSTSPFMSEDHIKKHPLLGGAFLCGGDDRAQVSAFGIALLVLHTAQGGLARNFGAGKSRTAAFSFRPFEPFHSADHIKKHCLLGSAFLCGGDDRARTYDLLDVNEAL